MKVRRQLGKWKEGFGRRIRDEIWKQRVGRIKIHYACVCEDVKETFKKTTYYRVVEFSTNGYIYKTTPAPKVH